MTRGTACTITAATALGSFLLLTGYKVTENRINLIHKKVKFLACLNIFSNQFVLGNFFKFTLNIVSVVFKILFCVCLKYNTLTFESLQKMRIALKRAQHFITCNGKFFGAKNECAVRGLLAAAETQESAEQLNLFGLLSTPQNALIALHGQL